MRVYPWYHHLQNASHSFFLKKKNKKKTNLYSPSSTRKTPSPTGIRWENLITCTTSNIKVRPNSFSCFSRLKSAPNCQNFLHDKRDRLSNSFRSSNVGRSIPTWGKDVGQNNVRAMIVWLVVQREQPPPPRFLVRRVSRLRLRFLSTVMLERARTSWLCPRTEGQTFSREVQSWIFPGRFRRFGKFENFWKISQTLSGVRSPLNLIKIALRVPFWSVWFRRFENFWILTY